MAMVDSDHRQRDSLPSIKLLHLDRFKTDGMTQPRYPTMANSTPLESSNTTYPGPPPPYSSTVSTNGPVSSMSGYISPPQSTRRSTRDENDSPAGLSKSLPSISEALGDSRAAPFSSPASVVPPPQVSSHHPPPALISTVGHAFPDAPKGPPNPFSQPIQPPINTREAPYSSQPTTSTFISHESQRPKSNFPMINTSDPVPQSSQHYGYPQSPGYASDPASQQSTTYENGATQSPYNYPTPRSSYPFSNGYPAPPRNYPLTSETSPFEQTRHPPDERRASHSKPTNPHPHAESVKRELDVYDAETTLKDITEASTRTHEFARGWSQRFYQSRSAFYPDNLPSLTELDDMMEQSQRIIHGFTRIREIVVAQQQALSEQRIRAARAPYLTDDYGPPDSDFKGAGGFAGGDAKKRRGKAAPPGRCHSCNRAETPEWRRGPDGARTLCNACGLHYAKLTRKNGPNTTATSANGSNLRPKNHDPRSPQ